LIKWNRAKENNIQLVGNFKNKIFEIRYCGRYLFKNRNCVGYQRYFYTIVYVIGNNIPIDTFEENTLDRSQSRCKDYV